MQVTIALYALTVVMLLYTIIRFFVLYMCADAGSFYTRWGRTVCGHDARLVHKGWYQSGEQMFLRLQN